MKRLIFTAIILAAATGAFAQSQPDTLKVSADTVKHKKAHSIRFGYGEGASYINIKKRRVLVSGLPSHGSTWV
jgi:hypothetical protein